MSVRLTRRTLLGAGIGTVAGAYLAAGTSVGQAAGNGYPFTLGVASGAPSPQGVVLWTRLATQDLDLVVHWVNNVPVSQDLDGRPVMTEFLTTGVSSNPAFTSRLTKPSLADNPQVRFYDERCGYTLCSITSASWRTQFVAADTSNPGGSVQPISSWIIEAGQTAAQPA